MGTQAISAFMRIKMGIKTVLMVFASRFGSVLMMCDIAPLKFIMTWGALFGAIEFTYQLEAHGGGVYKPMLEIAPAGFWQFWWGSYVSTRAIGVISAEFTSVVTKTFYAAFSAVLWLFLFFSVFNLECISGMGSCYLVLAFIETWIAAWHYNEIVEKKNGNK